MADAVTTDRQAWMEAVASLGPGAGFEEHWNAYQRLFERPAERGPPQIWSPEAAGTNLHALMAKTGQRDYAALHAWSASHRSAFWQATIEALDIPFTSPPETILDGDARQPTWLKGAAYNIASACFTAPGDRTAIIAGSESGDAVRVSYAELKARVDAVSHGLTRIGLQAGDAVALYLPMNVDCVAAYLGIVQAGMAAVSIPDSFAPAEVATRLRLSSAKAIITVDAFQRGGKAIPMAPKARQAAAQHGVRCIVIGEQEDGDIDWRDICQDAGAFHAVDCAPQDVTNILFSSGTTGEPKAIPWTHLTPIKAAADGHWHHDIRPSDVVAWPTNIGWMMGPWLIYASLVNGATMALFEGVPTSRAFIDFLRDAKVSMLGLVPAIVRAWREQGVAAPGDLPDVRVFSSTGEASNAHDYLYLMSLADYQAPIIEYCGGTEIGGGHLTGSLLQPASPATFTTAAMGLDFVVLDADGRPVAPGGMGEIFLVPPSIGLSQRLLNRDHDAIYYDDCPPGPDGQVLRRHGDEVQRLHKGFWAAQGRADDTMNLGGIKVGSIELERAMNEEEAVSETAAVAIPPPGGGADRLVVFAVAPGAPADLQARLQARIKARLNPLFRIHDVVLVDKLPRTASNKIMRRELRAQYAVSA